jgi:hypothetical protein
MGSTFSFQATSKDGLKPETEIAIIAAMLRAMQDEQWNVAFHFNRNGQESTAVSQPGSSLWTVCFRPKDGDPSRTRQYVNPMAAARAIYYGKHPETVSVTD